MNHLIDEQAQLDALAPVLSELHQHQAHVSVDTEFLREKTYNAKLCLVQLGIGQHQYCIDVLSIQNLDLLKQLFADEQVTKLLHAARQDMEVIWQTLGVLPKPVFDTQLAAAFCGMDLQLGHTALVQHKLGVELSKSQARTDWTRRPLSSAQLKYAAEDVTYLADLYSMLLEDLKTAGKLDWFKQELEELYDVERYEAAPEQAYLRLAGGNLSLKQQYVLRDLATWREQMAQQRNIPRTWVLRDDKLFDLAVKQPGSESEINDMGVFGRKSASRLAPAALKVITGAEIGPEPIWRRVEPLDKQQKAVVAKMMKKLKSLADENDIAQGLLGTRKDIESLFRYRESAKLLSGWRAQVVGRPLLELLDSVEG